MPQRRASRKGERRKQGGCARNGKAMESATERRIEGKDGTPLHARLLHASSPKGWVIVLHGLDDHLERYAALSRFLQEAGYDVVLYDQRGHGRSGGARTHVASFSEYVDDLERVRQAAQDRRASPPHLFGHSMGAVVALLAAMRQPEHWRSVIVQGLPLLPGRNIPKLLGHLVRAVRPLLSRLRAATGLEADALSGDAAVAQAYRRDPLVQGSVTFGWGAEFLRALHELREGASAITCPLLILHGESDTIARPEGARWLAAHAGAKDRKLLTYPGLKHELHNECPQ
jgi:alpha-beta hydrolase superfamily lysophospholipase